MTPTGLDDRIRVLIHDIADAAPAPLPFAELDADRSAHDRPADRSRRRAALVAAAAGLALILAITGAIVWLRSDDNTVRVPAARNLVPVIHEVVDYAEHGTFTCPNGPPQITGRFDRMRLESWGSAQLGRFRTHVTYPDGSTRDRMIEGAPTYNGVTKTWARGQAQGKNYSAATVTPADQSNPPRRPCTR